MAEKKKMDPAKKMKLIYSGELLIFAVIFAVLGILLLIKVIQPSETVRMIFNFITIVGGLWMIINLFWTIFSPKKRAKTSLLDVVLMVPLGVALIIFDIYCFVTWGISGFPAVEIHCLWVGIFFIYIALAYAVQGIYHYSHPIPGLLEALEEEEAEKAEEAEEETPPSETGEKVEEETPAQEESENKE